MKDQILDCVQCSEPFLFTTDEQQRYIGMGFDPPKRCPYCRKNRSNLTTAENHQRASGQKRRMKHSKDRFVPDSMDR